MIWYTVFAILCVLTLAYISNKYFPDDTKNYDDDYIHKF